MNTLSPLVTRVAIALKPHGFRRRGLVFARHRGDTLQLIALQGSGGNTTSAGRFYINVGIGFSAVAALSGATLACKATHGCHYSRRAAHLVTAPDDFAFGPGTDESALASEVIDVVDRLTAHLEPIESAAAMLAAGWLTAGSEIILRAQLRFVTGDRRGALEDVHAASAYFNGRRGMSVDAILRRSHLTTLLEEA